MLRRLWQRSVVVRVARTMKYLLRASKISPGANIVGSVKRVSIARRVTIGARSAIYAGPAAEVRIGEGVWISTDVEMETEGTILIGAGTSIQRRSSVNGTVSLGTECILAPNVFISSGTHPFRVDPALSIREQERMIAAGQLEFHDTVKPVTIGNDCWLGTNTVVCPGVTIGDGCVIGANSVVTKSLEPRGVYAGVPARRIGNR